MLAFVHLQQMISRNKRKFLLFQQNWSELDELYEVTKEELEELDDEKVTDKNSSMLNRFKRGRPKKPPPLGAEKVQDLEHVDDVSKLDEETLAKFNIYKVLNLNSPQRKFNFVSTVGKMKDFSAIQILREINFEKFENLKNPLIWQIGRSSNT